MREGEVGESPVQDARARRLAEDLDGSPLRGRPLRRRLRNFRPDVAGYLTALSGPRPWMERLREIEEAVARHEHRLEEEREALVAELGSDPIAFAERWRETALRWAFDDVNDLIERHNRFFPVEARLPMDPRTGDFVPVDGEHYEKAPLDARWILDRYPAERSRAA